MTSDYEIKSIPKINAREGEEKGEVWLDHNIRLDRKYNTLMHFHRVKCRVFFSFRVSD